MSDTINRENKDRLFKFIFGNEAHKEWTLSLYNALNGTDYGNTDDLEFTTIGTVLYMGMNNDVSFLLYGTMEMYEQQSTFNPNMPARFLIYAGMVYSRYISDRKNEINLYSRRQMHLPVPRLMVFYNGQKNAADRTVLSLADAFPEGSKSDIDVRVTMLNINYGHNRELMERCEHHEKMRAPAGIFHIYQ